MTAGKGFLIAAPQSGSGKTTVTLAVMAALARRGVAVAPFKCGPDFIDPGYHRLVTGRTSINLDAWMCPESFVRETFAHHAATADLAVIEGVMGLFDGLDASFEGSSAQVAAITGAPVVLVVNARGMAASAAPLVKGFRDFDPRIRLAGVIFNNVGSAAHADLLRRSLAGSLPGTAVFGCLPRRAELEIPSRHLGLVTAEDNPLPPDCLKGLADLAEEYLDLDALMQLAVSQPSSSVSFPSTPLPSIPLPSTPLRGRGGDGEGEVECGWGRDAESRLVRETGDSRVSGTETEGRRVSGAEESRVSGAEESRVSGAKGRRVSGAEPRIAVARDRAFCFVYEDNLRLLRQAGAELAFFSPLDDDCLPAGTSGIYLPGGYPELYAERLAANGAMLAAVRRAVADGMPVYAECGGFMYLTEGMESGEGGVPADFVGIYPTRARMLPKRKALGYRQVEVAGDIPLAPAGAVLRGHEFHYSGIEPLPERFERCYRVSRQGRELGLEGYRVNNCLASYVHLHFGSNAQIAPAFVAACRKRG
jgi:cobyrinic acid a,c-diamide synthase